VRKAVTGAEVELNLDHHHHHYNKNANKKLSKFFLMQGRGILQGTFKVP